MEPTYTRPKAALDSESKGEIITEPCGECGTPFERTVFNLFGRRLGSRLCPPCQEMANREAKAKQESFERGIREEKWNRACPLIYRDTNLNDARLRLPIVESVMGWEPRAGKGLGVIGTTGLGKTRCLFMALRKAFDLEMSVAAISHTKFSRIAMDAFSGDKEDKGTAREVLRELHRAEVLLLDDLGKPPSTERADSELEELIEERTSQGCAILWSANASGEWLVKRFGIDRGEPLVRRLAEFSDVTTL